MRFWKLYFNCLGSTSQTSALVDRDRVRCSKGALTPSRRSPLGSQLLRAALVQFCIDLHRGKKFQGGKAANFGTKSAPPNTYSLRNCYDCVIWNILQWLVPNLICFCGVSSFFFSPFLSRPFPSSALDDRDKGLDNKRTEQTSKATFTCQTFHFFFPSHLSSQITSIISQDPRDCECYFAVFNRNGGIVTVLGFPHERIKGYALTIVDCRRTISPCPLKESRATGSSPLTLTTLLAIPITSSSSSNGPSN